MRGLYRNTAAAIAALLLLGAAGRAQPPSSQPQTFQAARQPAACPEVRAPVCAIKFGQMLTYWSACKARADGADVVEEGEWCRRKSSGGD
jgi:hypothetical protein